jgi:transcription elongation factor Elf1
MKQKSLTVHCGMCSHEWQIEINLPQSIDMFVERTRAASEAGCPRCGARDRYVLLGPKPAPTREELV